VAGAVLPRAVPAGVVDDAMSLDIKQLHRFVVKPVLDHLGLPGGLAAERLVIGTALTESNASKLDQIGRAGEDGWGPALGLWQMEAATFDSHIKWMVGRQNGLWEKVRQLTCSWSPAGELWRQLAGNLNFACAMCRVHYFRSPLKLPPADDLEAMSITWKVAYNSNLGAGRPADFRARAAAIMTLVV
jgi:hypothetical protein